MSIRPSSSKIFVKIISALIVFTFSFNQVLFAQEAAPNNIESALDRLDEKGSRAFAPAYLQSQEAIHEELVAQKQDIENSTSVNIASDLAGELLDQAASLDTDGTPELQNRSSSEQPNTASETPVLTAQEREDSANIAAALADDGALIDYLNESALYAQRADVLAQNIAVAREGLRLADIGLEDAKTQVAAKEAEITNVMSALNEFEAESARIRQALGQLAEEKMSRYTEFEAATNRLNQANEEKTALAETMQALKLDLDSKKNEAEKARQELEFAKLDFNNTVSIVHQNLGDDFDIYTSAYDREYGANGRVESVTLVDKRNEIDSLTSTAKAQIDASTNASLDELDIKVRDAKDKVYADEATSLAQLDTLCQQREADIIAQRDQGMIDIEKQRVDVTNQANDQFSSLYNSISSQASYWSSRKAALYGNSDAIDAYIYAAAMATLYSEQQQSIASQWTAQIASINQQCADAKVKLESDAQTAIANIPAEKEAAINNISEQRDELLVQIDDAKAEQTNTIYTERDNALAALDEQTRDALSAISANESLILLAWQESYLTEALTAELSRKDALADTAQGAYDDSSVAYYAFISNTMNPALASRDSAQVEYQKTLADITLNEAALATNDSGIAPLNTKAALLYEELSKLNSDLSYKAVYHDQILSLLDDMLEAEELLSIKRAETESTYALILAQREKAKDDAINAHTNRDVPILDASSSVSLRGSEATEAIYQQANAVSVTTAPMPDNNENSPLLAMLPDQAIPIPEQIATDAETGVRVKTDIDYKNAALFIRAEEMPNISIDSSQVAPPVDISVLETFKSLFGREPSKDAMDIFNRLMLIPCLADTKLIEAVKKDDILSDHICDGLLNLQDYSVTSGDATYYIFENGIVSATIENKEYIFNDNGDIEKVLNSGGSEILKYLYNGNGDLEKIDFVNAKATLESASDSIRSSVSDRFAQYKSDLEAEKLALDSKVTEKYSEYLASIEERAASLEEVVIKEHSERKQLLETEKARLEALESYLTKKETALSGIVIDGRVYSGDTIENDIAKVRSQLADIGAAADRVDEDKNAAINMIVSERQKAIANLDGQKACALADIDTKIEGVLNSLASSEDVIAFDLREETESALSSIKTQEDYALIRYYFKEGLGREPTYDEMAFCAENGYTTKEALLGSALKDELSERQAFKDSVIKNIRSALEGDEFRSLTQVQKDAIISYLENQSLHFGTSAILPLLKALSSNNVYINEATLLTELILSEIKNNNLDCSNNAPLQISMNAIIDVAGIHNVDLGGFDVTLDQLEAALETGGRSAIALINDNHYVTVLNIDYDTVTYMDPSTGKNGANATVSKEEFRKKFGGNVITGKDVIDPGSALSREKLISAKGAGFWSSIGKFFKKIGDFFCDLFESISRIVTNVVNAVVEGIKKAVDVVVNVAKNIAMIPVNFVKSIASGNWGDALWTIGSLLIPGVGAIKSAIDGDWVGAGIQVGTLLLSAGLPGISAAASGIGQTIGNFASSIITPISNAISPLVSGISAVVGNISSAISNVVKPFIAPISQFVATIKGGLIQGIGNVGEIFGIKGAYNIVDDLIIRPTITQGILEGSNVTLKELGLNDTIANIGSAALAGYAGAQMSGNSALIVPVTLGAVAAASFQELGNSFNFDQTITSALSQIAGSFVTYTAINSSPEPSMSELQTSFISEDEYKSLTDFSDIDFSNMWQNSLEPDASGLSDNPTYAIYSAVDAAVTAENLKDKVSGVNANETTYTYDRATAILNYLNLLIATRKNKDRSSNGSGGVGNNSNSNSSDIVNNFLLMNGINNDELSAYPKYIETFASNLETASPGNDNITKIPLYNDMPDNNSQATTGILALLGEKVFNELTDTGRDVAKWLLNTNTIAADIYNKVLLENMNKWPDLATAMCYSGSGDPFLYLLNSKPELDVKALVLVGTPISGERRIENSNLETVVTIYGENDGIFFWNEILRNDFYANRCKLFANNPKQVNEVVIKLKGIGHTDYFYDPLDASANAEIRKRASEFIARVTARSKDSASLIYFLNRIGATQENGKYIVDLKMVKYD